MHPHTPVMVVATTKNPGTAAILGILFGPLGLLYTGFAPALLMFCVNVAVGFVTVGMGLILTWPLCGLVGWSRATLYNKKLLAQAGGAS